MRPHCLRFAFVPKASAPLSSEPIAWHQPRTAAFMPLRSPGTAGTPAGLRKPPTAPPPAAASPLSLLPQAAGRRFHFGRAPQLRIVPAAPPTTRAFKLSRSQGARGLGFSTCGTRVPDLLTDRSLQPPSIHAPPVPSIHHAIPRSRQVASPRSCRTRNPLATAALSTVWMRPHCLPGPSHSHSHQKR